MRGYFGVGIYSPKTIENLGTLWRSAYQFGASFIFTINDRYNKQASDTCKSYRHIPLFQFENWETFKKTRLYDCPLVGVEFTEKSIDLRNYCHPERAIYILGAEDGGLPNKVMNKCRDIIQIPANRIQSYNVAVSGSIVMYDRYIKNN